MSVKFDEFNNGMEMAVGDQPVGLRGGLNTRFNFPGTGIRDAAGAYLLQWLPGSVTSPNVNYIAFTSAISGMSPVISIIGTDTNVNLMLKAQGLGSIIAATSTAFGVPVGTTAQRPTAFQGAIRENTTTGYFEVSVDGSTWVDLAVGGGGIATVNGTANQITSTQVLSVVTLSIPAIFIAPGSIQATTSSAAASFLLNGSGSGTISILPQAAAGTYNFNLPTTAGTSGYLLTSAGGAGDPMTWTQLSSVAVTSIAGTANQITASASTGAVTLSIPSTFIAPGTIQATTSSAATSFLLNGATDGVISILPQAHAGTYNFNLPITAGTSGYLLTSAGGAGSPMTWSNPASISVTSISGTANQITASASTGAVTLSIPSTFIAPGTIQATTSSAATSFLLNGSSSGTITIVGQANAGTYNFNLPITAGTSGYVLTSAGGGGSPMTWTNLGSAAVTSIAGTANQITASASTGAVTLSIPSTFIAPGTIQATTSSAAASFLVNGSTDGVITIKGQAHAGTYEFDLPTTAGTSGYLLTSAGGAGSPMTWTANTGATAIQTIDGDAGSMSGTTVTINGGTTGLTTTAATATMSLTGTLKAVNGGTSVANSAGSLIALGLSDSGSANAYAVAISPAPAAYAVGQTISFIAAHSNTTASTLAVNALGTKAITKHGATALVSGDIVANQVCTVVYDGTQFQLENPVAAAGTGTVTSVTLATGLTAALAITGTNPITSSGTITLTSHGNFINVQVFTTGTAQTYTPTTGTSSALIKMVGGGGGGGSITIASSGIGSGGGGGSGAYVEHLLTGVTGTYTYTVGAGGAAAANGTASTFSGGTLSAGGGAHGVPGNESATGIFAGGGAGGSASGGNILNQTGCGGGNAIAVVAAGYAIGGNGAPSVLGGGAQGSANNPGNGIAAPANSGGGGSGANDYANNGTYAGGAGGSGVIVIYEYS